jgi:hypothetical protein
MIGRRAGHLSFFRMLYEKKIGAVTRRTQRTTLSAE